MEYISLHNHTSYSTLDGIGNPDKWAKAAVELGHHAIGLSDHGTISGAVDFYEACVAEGVKPIIGVELYVVEDPSVRERAKGDPEERYHACVYARNEEGFRSILSLLNFGHKHFYHRPRIGIEQLLAAKGVLITTACHFGLVRMARVVDRNIIPRLAEAHRGNFYLEIQPHDDKEQRALNADVMRWVRSHKLPVVATGDCHYPLAPFGVTHEVLLSIQAKKTLDEYRANPWFSTTDLYLMSGKTMAKRFAAHHPDLPKPFVVGALERTVEVADKCSLELKEQPVIMPSVGSNAPERMMKLIQAGIKKKFPKGMPLEYKTRVIFEVGVIKRLGFINYFLVVHDILRHCRAHNIEYGPGRGCFLPGSEVVLRGGEAKPIENVVVGDRVVSHDGSINSVDGLLSYDVDEEVVELEFEDGTKVCCTKDHKIWTTNRGWVEADGLTEEDNIERVAPR